ncbi:MAG TPA: stage II sporulation protein M [Planctomycetaceae bacterium]|nr:stage II sporulation protein M [Planctomycetaceae bacterium]
MKQASRLALHRVPLDSFQRGHMAYRQSIADLAYARMRFPDHPVVGQLEGLLARAHSVIYQARRAKRRDWLRFWRVTWPELVRQEVRTIAAATLLFLAAAVLGGLLTVQHAQLERFFISNDMREAMRRGDLWTEGITRMAPLATSAIATNNISVTLTCWALGVTFGLGTVWVLVMNGLMLGAIFAGCWRMGMHGPLAEFVVGHGALELPAIWIASAAGLVLGRAMVFPGRYPRSVEMRLAARRSVQLAAGTIPMLLVAAAVEGFVSPSQIPGGAKAAVGLALAVLWLLYILLSRGSDPQAAEPSRSGSLT